MHYFTKILGGALSILRQTANPALLVAFGGGGLGHQLLPPCSGSGPVALESMGRGT